MIVLVMKIFFPDLLPPTVCQEKNRGMIKDMNLTKKKKNTQKKAGGKSKAVLVKLHCGLYPRVNMVRVQGWDFDKADHVHGHVLWQEERLRLPKPCQWSMFAEVTTQIRSDVSANCQAALPSMARFCPNQASKFGGPGFDLWSRGIGKIVLHIMHASRRCHGTWPFINKLVDLQSWLVLFQA